MNMIAETHTNSMHVYVANMELTERYFRKERAWQKDNKGDAQRQAYSKEEETQKASVRQHPGGF